VIVVEPTGLGKRSALNESSPGRIFISYRRQDTRWPAGRLYEALVQHFPAEQIFKDVDSIDPGEDFVERITAAVSSCDVLLALIGPQWLTVTKKGQRRLDDPKDVVRLEIETALTRKIRVIPILVDDTPIPSADELPATLAPLVRRNAVVINPETFDTRRLITAVQKTLAEAQARQQTEEQARQQTEEQARQQAEEQTRREADKRVRQQAEDQSRRRTGRPPHASVRFWVLLVGLVAAAVIAYVLSGTLLAVIVIVPLVAVWGWQRRHRAVAGTSLPMHVDAAVDLLAARTLATWSQQVVQRGIQAPAPVRVRWQWAAGDIAAPRQDLAASPSLPTDPGPLSPDGDDRPGTGQVLNSGLVTRLHDEVYARLRHGRLVLIGGPGAGKTGAMILLLIEALRHRERVPHAARPAVPVPVWLTLGSWDPRSQGLRDWVTATIGLNHPYLRAQDFGPDAVGQLFDTGRIALFLDGLDEMPDMLRGAAVERLTAEAAGRRVVITSRPGEFRATVETGQQLPYTAVVELRPVGSRAAARYLLEGQIGATRQAWQDVADRLLAQPEGVLARTLNTPLTLSLARSAYAGGDPRELVTHEQAGEQTLRVHLLDQVLVGAYPDPSERDHATNWLGWLAHHMNTQPSGPTRDLSWWHIPGWIARWQTGLVGAIVGGLVLGLAFGLAVGLVGRRSLRYALEDGLAVGLAVGLLGGLVSGLVSGLGVRARAPRSMTIRRPTRGELAGGLRDLLLLGLAFGLGVGILLVLAFSALVRLPLWLGSWTVLELAFTFGLLFGLVSWLLDVWRLPLAATLDATPRSVYQRDVRSQLLGGLMGAVACLLGFSVIYGLSAGLTGRLEEGLYGLMLGLVFGPMVGLLFVLAFGAAPSLLLTEIAHRLKGRQVRFMPLLETALSRQVLRQAGAVYQFRHADLQDRLADRHKAGLMRRRAA
jgi:TIR domain